MKEWIGYILAIIFLSSTIVTFLVYDKKLDNLEVGISIDAIETAIEASDNVAPIYEFTQYEYSEQVIDSRAYGESLQKLVDTHDKLIEMVKRKSTSETNQDVVDATIKFLEARKDAYSNLKSAVDLTAENFKTVASNKFNEADSMKTNIQQMILNYKK